MLIVGCARDELEEADTFVELYRSTDVKGISGFEEGQAGLGVDEVVRSCIDHEWSAASLDSHAACRSCGPVCIGHTGAQVLVGELCLDLASVDASIVGCGVKGKVKIASNIDNMSGMALTCQHRDRLWKRFGDAALKMQPHPLDDGTGSCLLTWQSL